MKKYLAVAKITLANLLQYRLEFVIGQLRNVLLFLTLYFLWTEIYAARLTLFNFDQFQIITYIIMAMILRSTVTFSPSVDHIAGELQSWGKFFSYLLKPIGYLRYWFCVDLVYKIVSLLFILLIAFVFIKTFQITFLLPNITNSVFFLIMIFVVTLTYFYIGILISTTGFWTSQVWGLQFLVVLVLEFSAGTFFPIDVLPQTAQSLIRLTPFPYLLYYPISIFLGKVPVSESIRLIMIGLLWLAVIYLVTNFVWKKGLKVYEAWGG